MRIRSNHHCRSPRFLLVSLLTLIPAALSPVAPAGAAPPSAAAAPSFGQLAAAAPAVKCGPTGDGAPTETPWPLRRLDPGAVWPLTQGEGVLVAVIDSGVSAAHPALSGRVRPGRDFDLESRAGQCDEAGHGTLVAGIIAGRQDTDVPFSGIAPEARILPVRVLRGDRKNDRDESIPGRIARAIKWAVDEGAQVINLSLETFPTQALTEAVEYARKHDVVLIAAAGNQQSDEQRNQPAYPAGYETVIAVAGIDEQGQHVESSISGDYIDVAAPGIRIQGPAPQGSGYRTETGTSFATAYVSGVAALIRSRHPDLSADEVAERIKFTADSPPEGRNALVGYGVVNPYRAVTASLGSRPNPPIGTLEPPAEHVDSQASAKQIAAWAAPTGTLLAVLLLAAGPLLRRGRRRGWVVASGNRLARSPGTEPRSPGHGSPLQKQGRAVDPSARV
ncbi:MAG TPA: type VII secretion-associated serine protease mycosin [Micromonosporaceae bacterium]|nr:type VII secretion-associated serine protease mycosin [Micromonosporaceae bacterium]